MAKPNVQCNDDEIDLLPFIHALWKCKAKIIAAIVIGVMIALAAFYALPPKWVATAYVTKGSLLSVYKTVRSTEAAPVKPEPYSESKLYNSIQDDVFYIAMGILTANEIDVVPTNQAFIHRASSKAKSKELALSKLKSALDAANTQAININLPSLTENNSLRAFNTLGDIKTINSRSVMPFLAAGFLLGFIVGCLLVLLPLVKSRYEQTIRN